jgi:carbamoyl-phosphate synthase large subunit
LLTCVGGELLPNLILDLKRHSRHDLRIIGTDVNSEAVGRMFCDEFSVVPYGSATEYIPAIIELIEKYNVDLIIPTSDEEAVAMASNIKNMEKLDCKIACVEEAKIRVMTDKIETYHYLEKHGLNVPFWKKVNNFNEMKETVGAMYEEHGAIVVKPAQSRGGRGVHVISTNFEGVKRYEDRREVHSDLPSFFNKLMYTLTDDFPVIVMERLVEPVIDLDLLCWKGKPLRIVARKRVNSAVPNEGHIIIEDNKLIKLGEQLINIFELSWLYDCDVMYNNNGEPCVLEINPRQSGSIAISVAAGFPMIDDVISLAKGESVSDVKIPYGIKVVPYKSLAVLNK